MAGSSPTQRSLAYLRGLGYEVDIADGAFRVALTKGQAVLVDESDVLWVFSGRRWVASNSGRNFYAVRGKGLTRQYMHRLIAEAAGWHKVDHINGDTMDNRKSNLRLCRTQENAWNSKPRGKYKGVSKHKDRFVARITVNGKNLYLGLHPTEEDAARVYDNAATLFFGEFARTNFEQSDIKKP